MAVVIFMESEIFPTNGGIKAPPETAIIINPEISFALLLYFFTVSEYINGNRLDDANPIIKSKISAVSGEGDQMKIRIVANVANADPKKNFRDDIFVKRIAPTKVPNIFPKK